jgi:anhydro-N-acetylmuramic acid kinase
MIYKAIGITSGGNPASIKLSFTAFTVTGKHWQSETKILENILYMEQWQQQLKNAKELSVADYMELHQHFGVYIGQLINHFIEQHELQHQVQLIACNGHNIIKLPSKKLCVQLGDGASIAATTGLAVISDLSAIDIALGGNVEQLFAKADQLLFTSPDKAIENSMAQIPDQYKESVRVALLGVLRWREEATVLPSVNGATKATIGGALWLGSEA